MYNLNYRFDSLSPAGKCCGTALDLIKRYNDLAKEAGLGGNYVEMEVFRQYAEHYRKIVTEINERKNFNQNQQHQKNQLQEQDLPKQEDQENQAQPEAQEAPADNEPSKTPVTEPKILVAKPLSLKKKKFEIVEVTSSDLEQEKEEAPKPKRTVKRKAKNTEQAQEVAAV